MRHVLSVMVNEKHEDRNYNALAEVTSKHYLCSSRNNYKGKIASTIRGVYILAYSFNLHVDRSWHSGSHSRL